MKPIPEPHVVFVVTAVQRLADGSALAKEYRYAHWSELEKEVSEFRAAGVTCRVTVEARPIWLLPAPR